MKRLMIACVAVLAMLITPLGALRAADTTPPLLNFDELLNMFGNKQDGVAVTNLCDQQAAWWANPLHDEAGPLPPSHKIAAAILECRYQCTTNLKLDVTFCPFADGKGGTERREVKYDISVESIGSLKIPNLMPVGITNFVKCGAETKHFAADTLRVELHRQCTVNGSVQDIKFWMERPAEMGDEM